MELKQAIHDEICKFCDRGDQLADEEKFSEAIQEYKKARKLIPTPKSDWEAETWVATALGDARYFLQEYDEASKDFYDAIEGPGGEENPFINLRLGQCLYEIGDFESSQMHLLMAYRINGSSIFEDEPEKYFSAIEDMV